MFALRAFLLLVLNLCFVVVFVVACLLYLFVGRVFPCLCLFVVVFVGGVCLCCCWAFGAVSCSFILLCCW